MNGKLNVCSRSAFSVLYGLFCYTVLVVKLQSCLKFLEELVNTQRSALQRKLILRGSEPLLCKHEDMSWSP